MGKGFGISDNKGFHMTFENGWTVSIQFGYGNYGDNYNTSREEIAESRGAKSNTAEIAAWDENGVWHEFQCDGYTNTVAGHKSPDEVLAFINEIAARPRAEQASAA